MIVEVIASFVFVALILLVLGTVFGWGFIYAIKPHNTSNTSKAQFKEIDEAEHELFKLRHHLRRYIEAYKIKFLRNEMKARDVSYKELDSIIKEVTTGKSYNKHVLDVAEEEIRGDLDSAEHELTGKKRK